MSIRVYSRADLDALAEAEPGGWLWNGLLPRAGIALLAGAPRTGKTRLLALLAAAMTDAVCEGGADLGGRRVELTSGVMLLVAAEHAARDLRDALAAAEHGRDIRQTLVHTVREVDIDDETQAVDLAAEADKLKTDVIAVDPIRRVTRSDESSAQDVSGVARTLRALGAERRLVIVVHHVGHAGRVRGSTDWEAMADTTILVDAVGGDVRLRAEHHGAPPVGLRIRIRHEDGRMTAEEGAGTRTAANTRDDLDAHIVAAVAGCPGVTARELPETVGARGQEVRRRAKALADGGRLRVEAGPRGAQRYYPPAASVCVPRPTVSGE
ncbi:AAA family ATPase [Chondromyces crocatus]|uniref:AAA+ ATPase domain-containing protein n=1 Tax=Chondromyces crocatus TaxID=52 RepID=A0A0K1EI57_CHOCO|nr:AAA family ATPase [Chondromyces crocatus]AKT40551.1 uncharacterized protein CMC5_047070 [Chondromyces crocatus]